MAEDVDPQPVLARHRPVHGFRMVTLQIEIFSSNIEIPFQNVPPVPCRYLLAGPHEVVRLEAMSRTVGWIPALPSQCAGAPNP